MAYVKQEYFYSLAIGLKLEMSSRGVPCNLNVGELFQEALYNIPVQQWNSWLAQKFRDSVQTTGPGVSPVASNRSTRRVNTMEMRNRQ